MVGTIAEIVDDKSSNFYTLKVKPATNFFNIEYVYVIDNTQLARTKASGRFHAKKIPMSELLKNIIPFYAVHICSGIHSVQDAAPAPVHHTLLVLSVYSLASIQYVPCSLDGAGLCYSALAWIISCIHPDYMPPPAF